MSTQAIGAAVAGTAVVGGGGALAAYAAGEFTPTKTKEETVKNTYLTLAKEESDIKNQKEYMGDNQTDIKSILEGSEKVTYQASLEEVWDNMNKEGIEPTINKPNKGEIKTAGKENDISNYVNKWCEHIASKELGAKPQDTDQTWQAFKKACFKTKATQSTG
ncbi:hypothetical protein MHSWG343_06300 [Candidatus Mycoplasma haematohominis]|uniref:Uncharacterized protein n=1 Tax=Candidatus Mycoplasma haematohominis TaxID=1494318 RepID=A0A478FQB5_9MOLU|nr:hypothetical protein MHSWG343_06300 [Candidatus Mycoplasma haemohominis]